MISLLRRELRRLEKFSEGEVNCAKNRLKCTLFMNLESRHNTMTAMARQLMFGDAAVVDNWMTPQFLSKAIDAVGVGDVVK